VGNVSADIATVVWGPRDTEAFLAAMPAAFVGDIAEGRPVDPRYDEIAERVSGFTTPGELAVLHLAASRLPEGEAYLEVGTYKGRSICAALLDAPAQRRFVSVENFTEFGMVGGAARTELMANLDHYAGAHGSFRFVDGDCFAVLARPGVVDRPVGVYFYDGAHTQMAHFLALGVVEPLLADEALVLVDDATWPMVRAATLRYVQRHHGWSVLSCIDAATDHDPLWANGLMVLAYRRPAGARRVVPTDARWRRSVQVYARTPATKVIWRALDRFPQLVPVAKRLVPKRSRQVRSDP
jgi:predicted O-methyltransferase YrrM